MSAFPRSATGAGGNRRSKYGHDKHISRTCYRLNENYCNAAFRLEALDLQSKNDTDDKLIGRNKEKYDTATALFLFRCKCH